MIGTPLISVILPVYNVESYLDRCMHSLLNQTYKNLEIIMIDDGSTDSSGEICDKYARIDGRVCVIHQKNQGLSAARNKGIENSKGRYLTFVDSDDSVQTDMIEYLFYLLKKFDCKMSLCSHIVYFTKSKKYRDLGNGKEEKLSAHDCIKSMLYHGDVDTSAWAKLYSREVIDDIRFPVGKFYEDIATTYKYFIKSDYVACGFNSKYIYHVRDNSIVTGSFSLRKLDLLEMTDSMAYEVNEIYSDLKKAVLRRRVYARFSTLNQMLYLDNNNELIKRRKEIINFIHSNFIKVFTDFSTPKRDKFALVCIIIGFNFYKKVWTFIKNGFSCGGRNRDDS